MTADPLVSISAPTGWTTDSLSALEILANDLANNYLDTSLSLEDSARPSLRSRVFRHDMLAKGKDYAGRAWQPSRTILVLGSGASADAFGEDQFPLVSRAIDRVLDTLAVDGVSAEFVDRRLDEECERVATLYGFQRARTDFETQLGILSEIFSPESVANALSRLYSLKFAPHMTFELIAHMLKHRFIDAVINFNFDELLDVAINEEVGDSHLHYVISDGHCQPLSEIMIRDRIKIPLYIKPHGTASHRSTLRFTKDQYFRLPEAMYAFMRDIVSGHYMDSEERGDGYRPYRTNIVSVGFGMGSLDLVGMLRKGVVDEGRSDFTIFHFNKASWGTSEKAAQLRKETGVERQYLIDVEQFGGIEGTFRLLWRMVASRFSELYRPRGIARHEIVHQIFHRPRTPTESGSRVPRPSDPNYFFVRLCTEVVIALAKGNGRLDLNRAASDRVGIYFNIYFNLARQSKQLSSMTEVVKALGEDYLRWTGSAQNILTVRDSHRGNSAKAARDRLARSLWDQLSDCLRSNGGPGLEERIREIEALGCDDDRHPVQCLRRLVDSDTHDIKPRFSHRHLLLFRDPDDDQVLHTNLSVTINFVKMITELEWDLMLTISENGKVLEKFRDHCRDDPDASKSKYFSVIVAETDHKMIAFDRIRGFSKQLLGGSAEKPFYSLPITQHNHHMTLLLRHDCSVSEKWRPISAIYYEKIGMGNRVNPVLLREEQAADLDILITTFFAYVNKSEPAGARTQPPGDDTADSEWLLEAARSTRARLLEKWSEQITR